LLCRRTFSLRMCREVTRDETRLSVESDPPTWKVIIITELAGELESKQLGSTEGGALEGGGVQTRLWEGPSTPFTCIHTPIRMAWWAPRRSPFIKASKVQCLTCKCCSLQLVPASRPEPGVLTTPRLSMDLLSPLSTTLATILESPPLLSQHQQHAHFRRPGILLPQKMLPQLPGSILRPCQFGQRWSVSDSRAQSFGAWVHYSRVVSCFVAHGQCVLKTVGCRQLQL